jgi:hypothetical protein
MGYLRLYLLLLLLSTSLCAYANFDFNPNCIKAYEQILSLRLNNARTLIAVEKRSNPQNAIPYLLDNYVDYFTLLTTENKSDFEKLKKNRALRLSRIEKEDENSPYYLFAQAEINLQCALTRSRFDEFFTAGVEINKAYRQLQENKKKYPAFLPNQKNLGLIEALLGSMPDGLKKTMSAFGIRGTTQQGVKILENLLKVLPKSPYSHFYAETVFYLSYVKIDILRDAGAYAPIMLFTQPIDSTNLLRTYIRAYAGMKTGHNAEALTFLDKRPSGNAYQPYPYLDYLSGIAKMHSLNNSAGVDLQTYLRNYKGINFIKDAWLNLAWLALLKNDRAGYASCISKVKSEGFTYHDKDKQALNEANDPAPQIDLLKARLLFDGGYYDQAIQQISDYRVSQFKLLRDKIEYCYRLARIYDETGKDDIAIKFYKFAIDMGSNEKYYFAANSALLTGFIYEKKGNAGQAWIYFNKAISMKNHDYESSIENKAKEGLKKLGS